MKQNSRSIITEIAKSSGVGLNELNCAIESFGTGVADSMSTVIKQSILMSSEHLDDFLDRLQSATHGIVGPCVKEPFCSTRVGIVPELDERFFDTPCTTGFEIKLIQRSKRNCLSRTPICISLEPRILAACQRRRAHFRQPTVFFFTHRINRFPQIF